MNKTDSDTITGGAGNDYISSAANIMSGRKQWGANDQWSRWGQPAGVQVMANGTTWGVYPSQQSAELKETIWGGIIRAGFLNSVDSAHQGADFCDGGAGADTITGGGNADNLFGGAGDDKIWGDSSGMTDSQDYVALANHGADYIDGEDGNDYLEGGGSNAAPWNAIDLVATYARHSGTTDQFHCEIKTTKARNQSFR